MKDINSVLEVTVYDEDRDHRVDFIGKVSIPILRIRNGHKKWYVLKDRKLRSRAKGTNPQILLELDVNWNPVSLNHFFFVLNIKSGVTHLIVSV